MHLKKINIFSSSDMCVDFFESPAENEALVITFTERGNRNISDYGFATSFLLGHGFDVVAIKTNLDHWYENFTPERIEVVKDFISKISEKYSKTILYGSSMGGYAAVRFSNSFDANCVLAISPLYDIKDSFDVRWKNDVANLNSSLMMSSEFISTKTKYCFILDESCNDYYHLLKYINIIPSNSMSILNARYSGHPSGPYLRDIGSLSYVVLHAFEHQRLPANLIKFKEFKKNSNTYLFNLSTFCLKRGKIKWAEIITNTLISRNPLNPEYHMQSCRVHEKKFDLDRAIAASSRAASLNPANVNFSLYRDALVDRQLKSLKGIV